MFTPAQGIKPTLPLASLSTAISAPRTGIISFHPRLATTGKAAIMKFIAPSMSDFKDILTSPKVASEKYAVVVGRERVAVAELGWAARLYLVGLDIAHNDYHKHSAYIVQHVDLAGCSRVEQTQLATLVIAHRKRFPIKHFLHDNTELAHLAILLRLAAIFHRGKKLEGMPELKLTAENKNINLKMPEKWIQQHPLTLADLETEMRYLEEVGYHLTLEYKYVLDENT